MSLPRLFLCNGATKPKSSKTNRYIKKLYTYGEDENVHICFEDVSHVFEQHLSPRLIDFIEIASFVYAADSSTQRDAVWKDNYSTEAWGRDFKFVIPVRDFKFWNKKNVKNILSRTLSFLSDDKYNFIFRKLKADRHYQRYLDFEDCSEWPFHGVDRVILFSGGLDSLAGAVSLAKYSNIVLVSHRPVAKLSNRQINLVKQIRKQYPVKILHIPVWINKDSRLGREYTQRTRSFLYCTIGAVIAESLSAAGVSFYENGIVSLNLPVADEVLRARASRTTHPNSLELFSKICTEILDREFVVDNPFLFKTKKEVLDVIIKNNGSSLVEYTTSCAHSGHFQSKTRRHCGTCSQCIDRRISTLACGLEKYDDKTDYVSDVFTGRRKEGYERNMAINYVRHASELSAMPEEQIATKFSCDINRAVLPFNKKRDAAKKLIDMHKRHADTVQKVITRQIIENAENLFVGKLDETCLLALVAGQRHIESSWTMFCDKIVDILKCSLPVSCEKEKPKNEPHLQRICDGILISHNLKLVREYPFMRWASSLTKPDWSNELFSLWVEAKYPKVKSDIYKMTDAIAADITKYRDSGKRIQFIIYDPNHLIVDQIGFLNSLRKRDWIRADLIR